MALAVRRDAKDFIGVYYCKDWNLVNVIFIIKYLFIN